MITHETADWLNRGGLILGFLAFWFAAPEFIGETRLKKWERALAKGLLKLPFWAKVVLGIVITCVTCLYIFRWMMYGLIDTISILQLFILGVVGGTAIFLAALIPLLGSVISKLANDDHVRQRSLFFGGALFTLSFVLQFIATLR